MSRDFIIFFALCSIITMFPDNMFMLLATLISCRFLYIELE